MASAPTVSTAEEPAAASTFSKVTTKVTVQSVDLANRHVVVADETGEKVTLKVPEEFHNLDNLKPGDVVSVTYVRAMEILLSPPNKPLPKDSEKLAMSRAAKGQLPGGAIANHIVVTGAILGIDRTHSILKIVSPKGGEVFNVLVTSAEGRAALPKLKVGDKITAYITEGLLISTERS